MKNINEEILENSAVEDVEIDAKAVEAVEVVEGFVGDDEVREIKPFTKEEESGIYFILEDEEIVGIADSKTDDENCVLAPLEELDYSVLGKLFINGKIEEKPLSLDELKAKVTRDLKQLCDVKSVEAKTYIAGGSVSVEQLARYEEKYKMAKAFKADGSYESILSLEAELQGMSISDFSDVVIAKGEAYKLALSTFNAKIEAFRIQVGKLIEAKEFDKVSDVLEKAKDLGADATDDDVKSLFE